MIKLHTFPIPLTNGKYENSGTWLWFWKLALCILNVSIVIVPNILLSPCIVKTPHCYCVLKLV